MKSKLLYLVLGAFFAGSASAQQLTPVWEHFISEPGPIPVLTNSTPYTTDIDNGDGKSLMDSTGPLTRYDANRLLLGIRENGIDETAAGADLTLAAQYPDRSLIWINPTNGAPMGVALIIGLTPVPLDPVFIAAGGTPDDYWWTYTVGEDGAIYAGYKNKILKYAPNTSGGIDTNVVTVFTLTEDDLNAHGVDPTLWPNARWERLHVTGTGANTLIMAGATSAARGNFLLTTTDGTTFTAGSFLPVGGATSSPIPSQDPFTPDDQWVYAGVYPGNSNGTDSSYSRYTATPPFVDNFTRDGTFNPPADPFTYPVKYRNDFTGGLDAKAGTNFFVVYSTPSWNSRAVGIPSPRPGWLALIGHNGRFLSAHQLNITEDAELLSGDQASLFQGTVGYVTLNTLSDGSMEVLWSGAIYGYGRYLVTPYGVEPQVPEGGVPPGPFPGNTVGAANWIAEGSTTFDANVSIGLAGQGPIPWAMSRYNRGDFAVRLSPFDPTAAQDNFGLLQEFTGEGSAMIPSEQAWTPNANAGVIIPTARTNGPVDWGDETEPFYPVVSAGIGGSSGYGYNMITGVFEAGGTDIQTGKAGDQSANPSPEGNFAFATTWFPYNQGWIGAAIDNPDAEGNPRFAGADTHSPGLTTNIVSWPEINGISGGSALLSLPNVNATNDGMIFATSTQGDSAVNIISVAPQTNGWIVTARSAAESDSTVLGVGKAQFQFVYIPYTASNLVGAYVGANGTPIKSVGNLTVSRSAAGTYNIAIPQKNGTNGVLLLQNAAPLAGSTDVADNNFLSYAYDEAAGNFVVQSRHTAPGGSFPLTDTSFYVAWVDFSTPLSPPAAPPQGGDEPQLSIAREGASVSITWDASASGFTLEKSSALGPQGSWTSVGVVGEGQLATRYTIPAGTGTSFYRLRK